MTARILIPVGLGFDFIWLPWSAVCKGAVDASTRWSDHADTNYRWHWHGDTLAPPYGRVDMSTAQRLASALEAATPDMVEFAMALSKVYCETLTVTGARPLQVRPPATPYWQYVDAELLGCNRLSCLIEFSHRRHRFPVAIWPMDLKWSLAAPLYSDSWFVSGERALIRSIQATGLEVYEIDPTTPTPAEGD
jgi:hypothetical protein